MVGTEACEPEGQPNAAARTRSYRCSCARGVTSRNAPALVLGSLFLTLLAPGSLLVGSLWVGSLWVGPFLVGAVDAAEFASGDAAVTSGVPLRASGDVLHRWQIGDADAYLFEGDCLLEQQGRRFSARSILLVVDGDPGRVRTRLVMSGVPLGDGSRRREPIAAVDYATTVPEVSAPLMRGAPGDEPRLMRWLPPGEPSPIRRVQHQESLPNQGMPLPLPSADGSPSDPAFPLPPPIPDPTRSRSPQWDAPDLPPGTAEFPPNLTEFPPGVSDGGGAGPPGGSGSGGFQFFVGGGTRAIEILGRGTASPPVLETINRPESRESIVIARGGVTILVRDVTARTPAGDVLSLGTVSLSADRVVGWLPLVSDLFRGTSDLSQAEGELYLEGDIVFRQGDRVIYADAMYYNVSREVGMVLDAEAITTVPEFQGVVRLKAEILRQVSRGDFLAVDAAVTTSRMGVPRYWLQSRELRLTDRARTTVDPVTGGVRLTRDPYVSSSGNFVYLGGVPVLYWPRFASSLQRSNTYLRNAKFRNDNIFGTQLMLEWDLFQILGWENAPEGIDVAVTTDYLSDRGPAIGSKSRYDLPGFLGLPGRVTGTYDSWLIRDRGLDTLGSVRRNLVPETDIRGRALLRHRHQLPNDFELLAELGYLSDRNFLEQYLEQEWDQDKDHDTGVRLRKYGGSQLLDLSANLQINDFYQETERLPRIDHYVLGSSWLGDRLTWSAHNKVGYTRLNVADTPLDPIEAASVSVLPGELGREGLEAGTRQELALPVSLGPLKLSPFISGEAVHYGQAADGNDLTRLTGQAGIRAALPMWRADPTVQSGLLNVRGLAHKVDWSFEYFAADSNASFDQLPFYDSLDDNSQEQFRRRFIVSDYGGVLPAELDPRTYALRHGFQRWVASPSDVIVDDLQQVRLGVHQRVQTKRGLPGRERVTDLFQFDVDTILFPNAERDNFGQTLGPTTYLARYHVGDRVALLSDGYFDFFDLGLRSVSAGVRASRPGMGDLYVGLLSLEGPISSTVLRTTLDYRLNEKWIATLGNTYDFGQAGNVGQAIGITRIGESFLLRLAVNVDPGRDNIGFGFAIEPRFLPVSQLGRLGGQLIPPPGSEGLE